jgi:ABC-type Fe3+ transport system substrate-binding protein
VQYLGIINKKDNWEECQGFIDYILEPQCQAKLESLGLISVLNKQQNVYGNENIQRLNHSLSNDFYTCSAFMKKDELNRVNDAAIGYLMGSDEAKKAIEEYKSRCFMQ